MTDRLPFSIGNCSTERQERQCTACMLQLDHYGMSAYIVSFQNGLFCLRLKCQSDPEEMVHSLQGDLMQKTGILVRLSCI